MNTTAKITLLAALIVPGMALAQIDLGQTLGTEEAAIRTALEAEGYIVTEIEFEDDEIEAEVTLDGVAYEIELSAETGEVIEMALEDGPEDEVDDEND